MPLLTALLLICALTLGCSAQAPMGEYEMVSIEGRPLPTPMPTGPMTTSGMILLRGDSFAVRLTFRVDSTFVSRRYDGTVRREGEQTLLVPNPATGPDLVLAVQPGSDSVLRLRTAGVRAGAEEYVFRRVQSTPWVDGEYEAVRWNGIPLPVRRPHSEISEYTSRSESYAGGRYRVEHNYRQLSGSPSTSVARGSYEVKGQEIHFRIDDPTGIPPGRSYWSRRPDGTLRLTSSNGDSWEYRLRMGAAPPRR